jgi:hypothetical protein
VIEGPRAENPASVGQPEKRAMQQSRFSLGMLILSCPLILVLRCPLVIAQTVPEMTKEPINIYDGFETPALSRNWMTVALVPESISIQSDIVRAGHSALRITLHPHDVFSAGLQGDSDSERDELVEAYPFTTRGGIPYESSWSMYLPADFPIVPVRLVVAQWLENCRSSSLPCYNNSPVLAVRYINGVLLITQDLDHHYNVLYHEKRDLRGHWLDLRFQIRFTPQSTGFVRAWLDGKQVVDFTGITSNPENAATGYTAPIFLPFKMGLYRNVMPQPMTIYLDEYRKRELGNDELHRPAKMPGAPPN